jgi:hypothetical protein
VTKIIHVTRYAAYVDQPLPTPSNSIDLYKYYLSTKKYEESIEFFEKEHSLLPLNTKRVKNPLIAYVLDGYEELVQKKFYQSPENLCKGEREKIIQSIRGMALVKGLDVRRDKKDSFIVFTERSLISMREKIKNPYSDENPYLRLFHTIKSMDHEERMSLLEESVISKRFSIMRIFKNSIFFIEGVWYHTFEYRHPRSSSYNVSYTLTKPKSLTKKMIRCVNPEEKEIEWKYCSKDEEKRIWSAINPKLSHSGLKPILRLIFCFADNKYRLKIIKPGNFNNKDKRHRNRGKDIWSYSTVDLKTFLMFLVRVQYEYRDQDFSKIPKNKTELIQNIKWIFFDQSDIILI